MMARQSSTLRHWGRLIATYVRLSTLNELQYRANFFVRLFQALLSLGTAIGGLAVIFSHTDEVGGWQVEEIVALLGIFFLVRGFIYTVIQPSLERFMQDIRKGTLDFTLTKPEDAQFLVSIRQVEIWSLLDVIMGLGVLIWALARLNEQVSVGDLLIFCLLLLAGGVIVYSFWLILATCAYWFVRIENILVIFQSMYEAGRWPIRIYPQALQTMLTFLVPVAFAVTVPAEALTGRLTVNTSVLAAALAIGLFALSRWFWLFGIKHYSGASA